MTAATCTHVNRTLESRFIRMRFIPALLSTIALALGCSPAWSGTPVRISTNPDTVGVLLGDILLYPGNSAAAGIELWRSDGTAAGRFRPGLSKCSIAR